MHILQSTLLLGENGGYSWAIDKSIYKRFSGYNHKVLKYNLQRYTPSILTAIGHQKAFLALALGELVLLL